MENRIETLEAQVEVMMDKIFDGLGKTLWDSWDILKPYYKKTYSTIWGRFYVFSIDNFEWEICTFDDDRGVITHWSVTGGED